MVQLKDGPALACACGKPLQDGKAKAIIRFESGDLAGERMVCHVDCLKPADDVPKPLGLDRAISL